MRRRDFLSAAIGSSLLSTSGVGSSTGSAAFTPSGRVLITNARESVVGAGGATVFVAANSGFATVDVSTPSSPTVLAERRDLLADRDTGPLRDIADVKIEGDRLIVAGPANPLQGEVLQGVLLYDVSDPADPRQLAFHETDFPIHNAFIRDETVYLTGNNGAGNPLVIVDVSDDRPAEVGRWSMLDKNAKWGDVPATLRTLHDIWVSDGLAYLVQWDAGTWIVDVSDPTSPRYVSNFGGRPVDELAAVSSEGIRDAVIGLPGNHHYAMVDEDTSTLAIGKEAWATDAADGNGGPGGIELWDVSEPERPGELATIDPPPTDDATIGGTWTTAHNFDLVGDRLYTSWYEGGVKVHDVSDPQRPSELAAWRREEDTLFWTAKKLTDSVFVASSAGRRANGEGGLFAFPIP